MFEHARMDATSSTPQRVSGTPGGTRAGARPGTAVALALLAVMTGSACAAPATAPTEPKPIATSALPVAPPSPSASTASPRPSTSPAPAKPVAGGGAAEAAFQLIVKGRAPSTGYSREQFGQAWADVDRNGCDTRNDILERDLTGETFRPGTNNCVVLSGTLADPYLGQTYTWVRGAGTSSLVQIDHVVALNDAWQKGAQRWTEERRTQFANDPLNLLAVNGRLNSQKGASDAASWLPPNKAYRCAYVSRQVTVKGKYGLWVTQAEKDAMIRVLSNCADPGVGDPAPTAEPTAATAAPTQAAPSGANDPRFGTCTAAKTAGYGPYRRALDPEYAWYRDKDGDGVVCE